MTENTQKTTVLVKDEQGNTFELPYLYVMPRPIYKLFRKASEVALEVNEATAILKNIGPRDDHAEEKRKFQLERLEKLGEVYEANQEKIEEAMNEFIPGWKEFSYSLSQRAWTSAIGRVLGTGVNNPSTLEYDERLDFTQQP